MKTQIIFILLAVLIGAAVFCEADAQVPPPPGAGDKSLEDRNIKGRSVEMERIKRDSNKAEPKNQQQAVMAEEKFREIKEDFEQVQVAQSNIVAAYQKGKTIDYSAISAEAEQVNRRSTRLRGNLFPPPSGKSGKKEKAEGKAAEPAAVPSDVRTLIVEMDNTLAAFTSNPVFTSPQTVNAEHNAKALADLDKLIRTSAALKSEAAKMAKQ